mgnify:CR=1 FL=1|tara:strand:- start:1247 stop:2209 length:963 start_codon:yes stop_codon:yes gene_type:complete
MSEFREFYIQAGAGSNFLASKCLWSELHDTKQHSNPDTSTNEFYFNREKTPLKFHVDHDNRHECYDDAMLSDAKRVKLILIELDKWMTAFDETIQPTLPADDNSAMWRSKNRNTVINNINELWRKDWTMYFSAFYQFNAIPESAIPSHIKDMVTSARDYFAKSREYYYKVCERNEYNSFLISHNHPYLSISPRLKSPTNFKTLGMVLDPIIEMMCRGLQDIKSNNIERDDYEIYLTEKSRIPSINDMFVNKGLKWCDDRVSYRKIFFDNDLGSIRKLYDFFNNEDYFDKNRVQIMKEFKEYHNNNMKVLKELTPTLYKQL